MAVPFFRRSTKDKYPIVTDREFSEPRKPVPQPYRQYKPFPTKTPFLAIIALLVIACITAIELAFRYGSTSLTASNAQTRRALDLGVAAEDCAVIITVGILTTYYVSAQSIFSSDVQTSSQTQSPPRSCLLRRQTSDPTTILTTATSVVYTTVSESYVYAGAAATVSASSPPTASAAPSAYALVPSCTATQYIEVVITYDSSSQPIGTLTSSRVDGSTGTDCTTVTESVSSNVYATDALPPPTSSSACFQTVTATVVDAYYMLGDSTYSTDVSVYTPTASDDGQGCSTVTISITQASYVTVAATTVSDSYAIPSAPPATSAPSPTVYITNQTPASSKCQVEGLVVLIENFYVSEGVTLYSQRQTQPPSVQAGQESCITHMATTTLSSIHAVEPKIQSVDTSLRSSALSALSTSYAVESTFSPFPTVAKTSISVSPAAQSAPHALAVPSTGSSVKSTVLGSSNEAFTPSTGSSVKPTVLTSNNEVFVLSTGSSVKATVLTSNNEVFVLSTGSSANPAVLGSSTVSGIETVTVVVDVIYSTSSPSSTTPSGTYILITATASSTGATTNSAQPDILPSLERSQLVLGHQYAGIQYFCANYLGVLLAVMLKGLWAIVFTNAKMMEPFYQLQKPDGASVTDSLLANYLSSWLSWRSIRAMFRDQWQLLLTTSIYALMSVLSPISTEVMSTYATAMCIVDAKGDQQRCGLRWILEKPWARALEGVLILLALLIFILMVASYRRKSGVQTNPSTIASMASLLHHRETIDEIRALDPHANNEAIYHALSGSTYRIGQYTTLDGQPFYGIMTLEPVSPRAVRTRYSALKNPENRNATMTTQSHFTSRALRDAFFLLWVASTFGVVLGYYLASGPSPFNDFFNSGKWYPRFILTSVAVIINLHWKTLEREIRVIVPYRRLSARRASPEQTILAPLNGTPLTCLIPSLWRGDIFHAFIAFVAITSDLLIIAIAGVPFSKNQVWRAFLGSAYASMAILGLMILALLVLFIWRIQNEKLRLPREPDTLLGVWMMLCNDKNMIRKEFKGAHTRDRMSEISGRCITSGRTYYAGWLDWDLRATDGPEGREVMAKDEVTRRFVVDREDDGQVVGYAHAVYR